MKLRKNIKARKALDNFHMAFFRKLVDMANIKGESFGTLYQSEFELWCEQVCCPLCLISCCVLCSLCVSCSHLSCYRPPTNPCVTRL